MNIITIIEKKKNKIALSKEEIDFFVDGYVKNLISDAQASSLLMAICINDMTDDEVYNLTEAMIKSGNILDLSSIPGIKIDKHSTGGVGDKTTLVVAPLVASLNVPVAKLSGRGLGHTGGTIDKLESIKGFNSSLTDEEFINEVKEIGMVDACQTNDLVPADKKMYALRDVTGTTRSIPLIASSIMSKKIASGADKILLDVKTGSGALMTNYEDSLRLAKLMVYIGNKHGKKTVAVITDMNEPLGNAIGNGLEVIDAIKTLNGDGNERFTKLCLFLATQMVMLGKNIKIEDAAKMVLENYKNKKALEKFKEFVKYQGGMIDDIMVSSNKKEVRAVKSGYVKDIDEVSLAVLCEKMGSGRINKDDTIKYGVGMVINKHVGDYVNEKDLILTIYYDDVLVSESDVLKAYTLSDEKVLDEPIVYDVIS